MFKHELATPPNGGVFIPLKLFDTSTPSPTGGVNELGSMLFAARRLLQKPKLYNRRVY